MSTSVQDGTVRLQVVDAEGKTVTTAKQCDGSIHDEAADVSEKKTTASKSVKPTSKQ